MKTKREELIDFLNYLHEEAFIDPAVASLADEVLVDTYLKSINSASNESLLCAICPDCGGDGEETCHNPDHGFIHGTMGWHEIGRLGCPVCGYDPI